MTSHAEGEKPRMPKSSNLRAYEQDDVVAHYREQIGLQDCEIHLFQKHLRSGTTVLDIGVGAGRTTPYLSALAGRYVGADYSEAMVATCRARWPDLEFRHCDATDMSQFDTATFDAVIFSFNGIDEIPGEDGRARCLREVARVLKPNGVFIFSSHNAKLIGMKPVYAGADLRHAVWRTVRSLYKSVVIAYRNLSSGVFSDGHGYVCDPVHGGLKIYVSTPDALDPQLRRVGLIPNEVIGSLHPRPASRFTTPWFYYACIKDRIGG